MRLKDGSKKNFEDRTGQGWWNTEASDYAAMRLQSRMRQGAMYRGKKDEGLKDSWVPLRKTK
jgi:hypothetical protein